MTTPHNNNTPGEVQNPSQPGPGSGQNTEPLEQDARRVAQSDIIRQCAETVESYRKGEISKPVAVGRIGTQLAREDASLDARQANTALSSYLEMLDDWDREREERERAPEQREQQGAEGPGREHMASPEQRSLEQARPRVEVEESRAGSHDDEEPSAKRTKLDVAAFPWARDDSELSDSLRPELRETLKLLRVYAADVKGTKLHLVNSVGAPEFPESEWTNVLLGRAIDLDRVLTGHYTAGAEGAVYIPVCKPRWANSPRSVCNTQGY